MTVATASGNAAVDVVSRTTHFHDSQVLFRLKKKQSEPNSMLLPVYKLLYVICRAARLLDLRRVTKIRPFESEVR